MAIMAAPVAARAKLFPLFAFNIEVSRAPWVTQESMIAEMRLQWWRDALEEMRDDSPVPRHAVVTPLAAVLTPAMAQSFDALIEARRWDIYKDPFEDEAAFRTYLDRTTGNLLVAACGLLGAADEEAVREMAFAHALIRWFQAIPELENQGRQPLVDGRASAVADLAQEALARRRAVAVNAISKTARAALYCTWQDAALLTQVAKDPMLVADGALGQSEFRRKAGLLRMTLTNRL
jgi:phytoene/squalene synthetase